MQEQIKRLVAKSSADFCEVRVEATREVNFGYQGKNLNSLRHYRLAGGSIRALINGGWGFVSFNSFEDFKDLERQLKLAEEQAHIASNFNPIKNKFIPLKPIIDQVYVSYKDDPRRIPLSEKIELFEHYNNLLLNFHSKIASTNLFYFDSHTDWLYANTEGTFIYQEKMDLGGDLSISAFDGHTTSSNLLSFGSSNDFSVARISDEVIKEAAEQAVELLTAPTVKGGEYTVILNPVLAGIFIHEAFGHLSEADGIYADKNLSKLMQIGTQYGAPLLNVYDTSLTEGLRGYYKYDDEGVAGGKVYLIKDGILAGHLHTRESAAMMNARPTGNARALNYSFPPIARMSTTCIANGTSTFKEMLADIDEGIYAVDAYGGETNGELFTFDAQRGYRIKNGKLGEMVKNITISGNVFQTLRNIDKVGNDFSVTDSAGGCGKNEQSPLPTSEGSPHIRVRNLLVGGEG